MIVNKLVFEFELEIPNKRIKTHKDDDEEYIETKHLSVLMFVDRIKIKIQN